MTYHQKYCPVCKRVGEFHTYCSNKCKQKAYRQRLDKQRSILTKNVSEILTNDLSENDYMLVFRLLNSIRGKRDIHAVSQALTVITSSYRHAINIAAGYEA